MNFAALFIRRPITTTLIMLGITLFGVMSYQLLPVSDLPTVDFPTIQVQAGLPSTVPAAMRLLDAEPVGLRKATGLSADAASGQQTTKLELSLPLLDKIPPNQIKYRAATQFTDLELRDAQPGYTLADDSQYPAAPRRSPRHRGSAGGSDSGFT